MTLQVPRSLRRTPKITGTAQPGCYLSTSWLPTAANPHELACVNCTGSRRFNRTSATAQLLLGSAGGADASPGLTKESVLVALLMYLV